MAAVQFPRERARRLVDGHRPLVWAAPVFGNVPWSQSKRLGMSPSLTGRCLLPRRVRRIGPHLPLTYVALPTHPVCSCPPAPRGTKRSFRRRPRGTRCVSCRDRWTWKDGRQDCDVRSERCAARRNGENPYGCVIGRRTLTLGFQTFGAPTVRRALAKVLSERCAVEPVRIAIGKGQAENRAG